MPTTAATAKVSSLFPFRYCKLFIFNSEAEDIVQYLTSVPEPHGLSEIARNESRSSGANCRSGSLVGASSNRGRRRANPGRARLLRASADAHAGGPAAPSGCGSAYSSCGPAVDRFVSKLFLGIFGKKRAHTQLDEKIGA